MKKFLMGLATSLALGGAAQAATFTGSAYFSTAINVTNPGLQAKAVVLAPSGPQGFVSAPLSFDLDSGDSFALDLFIIRTLSATFAPDDTTAKAFGLVFDFGALGSATVTGATYAETSGGSTYGVIDFDGPALIDLGLILGSHQGLFITLADAIFNAGPAGFYTPGKANGAVIGAEFAMSTIPVPASLPLGLSALVLLGLVARRRKAAALV